MPEDLGFLHGQGFDCRCILKKPIVSGFIARLPSRLRQKEAGFPIAQPLILDNTSVLPNFSRPIVSLLACFSTPMSRTSVASSLGKRSSVESAIIADLCEDHRCATRQDKVYFCVDCSVRYCNTCWDLVLPHQPGRTARDGIEHERTDFHAVKRLQNIMNPPSSHHTLHQLHNSDEDTTWFGMPYDEDATTRAN